MRILKFTYYLICQLKWKGRNDSWHTAYTIRERVGELREKKRQVYTEKKWKDFSNSGICSARLYLLTQQTICQRAGLVRPSLQFRVVQGRRTSTEKLLIYKSEIKKINTT